MEGCRQGLLGGRRQSRSPRPTLRASRIQSARGQAIYLNSAGLDLSQGSRAELALGFLLGAVRLPKPGPRSGRGEAAPRADLAPGLIQRKDAAADCRVSCQMSAEFSVCRLCARAPGLLP